MIFQNWKEGENRVILNKVTSQVTRGRCCSLQHINPSRSEPQPSCVLPRLCAGKRAEAAAGTQCHPSAAATCSSSATPAPLLLGMQECLSRGSFPKAFRRKNQINSDLKIPAWVLALSWGVFKLWYCHPEEKNLIATSYSLQATGAFWLFLYPD